MQNVTQILQAENLNLPGGTVQSGNLELTVRTTGEFGRLEQIANLNIPSSRGTVVKLKDVAAVYFTYDEAKTYVLFNGQPAVGISLQRRPMPIRSIQPAGSSGSWNGLNRNYLPVLNWTLS